MGEHPASLSPPEVALKVNLLYHAGDLRSRPKNGGKKMKSVLTQFVHKHYDNALVDVDIYTAEEARRREATGQVYSEALDRLEEELRASLDESIDAVLEETQASAYANGMRTGARLLFELLLEGGVRA